MCPQHEVVTIWLQDLKRAMSPTDGSVDYLQLSPYDLTVDLEKKITKLEFFAIESDVDIAAAGFTDDFGVKTVWLDMQATLCKPHVAPTRLESFFVRGNGPQKIESISKGSTLSTITTKAA